jgi:uncharacterized membrane protein
MEARNLSSVLSRCVLLSQGDLPMRAPFLAAVPILVCLLSPVAHAETPKDIKGLYLLSDYPAVSVRPGTTSTLSLRLQNYGLAPQRYDLSVGGVPQGWTATLLGGGQPVAAAMPATDGSVSLQLRLDVPTGADVGTQTLTVSAQGGSTNVSLPIAVTLAKELPAKLSVQSSLPDLRGSPKSNFDYQLSIKNDSGRNLTVSFAAAAPKNFDTSFTEAYGSQELSAIPIDAGQSKDVKLHVRPPSSVDAGRYPVAVTVSAEDATAKTEVGLEIVGQPRLQIAGRDGLVSASAQAGKQSSIPVVVSNDGTAAAENIELSGSPPNGWKLSFEPKTIERIEPGKDQEVQALVTPTDQTLAGDYITTIRAASRGETNSTQFRIGVTTSSIMWVSGVGVICVALLVMFGAVTRFGRR